MPRQERPLAGEDALLLDFAADLRLLRKKAGSPTYRQLALRAHASAASLSVAASGRRLPTLAVTMAYVEGCNGDTTAWRRRWHDAAAALAAQGAPPGTAAGGLAVPYPGAAPFRLEDVEWFFGRDALVTDLLERFRQHRVVAVTGPSGVGKTSLLHAGLLARLRAEGHRGPIVTFTPGPHPLRQAVQHLGTLDDGSTAGQSGAVVVIDQFEELFTLCRSTAERFGFLAVVGSAMTACPPGRRFVICTRADIHDRCLEPSLPSSALLEDPMVVGAMAPEDVHQAITAPGFRAGCAPDGALTAVLMAAAGQPGALPLVSAALHCAWSHRAGGTLTLSALRAAGGIEGVIGHRAEAAFAEVPDALRGRARSLLLRMTAADGVTDAPPVALADLDEDTATRTVLETLVRARVVTVDRDRVSWAHSGIPRMWTRLAHWVDADSEGVRTHRRLTEAARRWQDSGRPREQLYRGADLAAARALCGRGDHEPTARERAFLAAATQAETASRRAAEADRARLRGQQRLITGLAALAAALAAVLAGVATGTGPLHRILERLRRTTRVT